MSDRENQQTIAKRLINEIGDYDISEIMPELSPLSQQALYKECDEYQAKHKNLIRRYKKTHSDPTILPAADSDESHFFRICFINHISRIISSNHPHYNDLDGGKTRRINPESATVSLMQFLGQEGSELYKLALKEESASIDFRDSVMRNATKHFTGKKWSTKPIIVMAGPSSAGKTRASYKAIENADQFLPKQDGMEGNTVIFIDGGIIRETSQVRKLAIQAANANGYSGILDLHDKSSILERIKNNLQIAATHTDHGMIVPLTFSKAGIPVVGDALLKYQPDKKNINTLLDQPNSTPIFCRIEGKNPKNFRQVVKYMGSRRAWKTNFNDDPNNTASISLNIDSDAICESKAYNKNGFSLGVNGSRKAENLFKALYPKNIRFSLTNDLVLVKYDPASKAWIPAQTQDDDTILTSEEHLTWWTSLTNAQTDTTSTYDSDIPDDVIRLWQQLKDNNQGKAPSLKDFAQAAPYAIKTLEEIGLTHLAERVYRHINGLNHALAKLNDEGRIQEMNDYKLNIIDPFISIAKILETIDPRNKNHLASALNQVTEFKHSHFKDAPIISPLNQRLMKATQSSHTYLKEKSPIILEQTITTLKSLLKHVVLKNSLDANAPTIKRVIAIRAIGLLKDASRKKLNTFIQSRSELKRISNTTQHMDIAYTQQPDKHFSVTDTSISTTYKDVELFKTMIEAFLASTGNTKKMRIYAQDNDVKVMIQAVCQSLNLDPERYHIDLPVSLDKAPTLFKSSPVETPDLNTPTQHSKLS